MKLFIYLVIYFFFFTLNDLTHAAPAQKSLILSVHPYLSASELINRFTPLCRYLSQKLGENISIRIAKDYDDHIKQIGEDNVDIAFIGPAPYIKMVDKYGKKRILARMEINGKPTFQGVIMVAKSSSFQSLKDLTGKRFAFGDPNSTMSHLVPRFMMWNVGISSDKLESFKFLHNHNNVALGVLMGDFDAGAVKEEVFDKYRHRGLRVLTKTPSISEHLFVANNSLPQDTINSLKRALLNLKNEKEGLYVLSKIKKNLTNMVPAEDKDYDNLRTILRALAKIGVQP